MPSRRSFLAALGAASTSLAGCNGLVGSPPPDDPPEPGRDSELDPERHVHGADGAWSSYGCNPSNTRTVADGRAPVDGVTERWRVEVVQMAYDEPVAAGGRVFFPSPEALRAFDAADGTELWTRSGAETPPVVRDGTVYVGAGDRLLALAADTADLEWELSLEGAENVGAPTALPGDGIYAPAGETLYKVDPDKRTVEWSRRLFGEILGPPAYAGMLDGVAFATEAGKVYALDRYGAGLGEWSLPATPEAPATADVDAIYVNCLNGETYGIGLETEPRHDVDWHAETGWASAGIAASEYVYTVGQGLRAVDPESGDRTWEYDSGDWRWTAPALVRDTLFVGGDALYALDPTPGSGTPDAPAVRFEESFHGRVGPGPVLDDGVVYVVAQTGEETFHLLALE